MDTFRKTRRRYLSPVQVGSAVVGAVFLLVGFIGFIPGVTTGFGDMALAGADSHAHLLGLFQTSVLHNVVHLAFGVAGVSLARAAKTARLFLLVGGGVYLLLALYGLVIDRDSELNFVPLNTADNWLHLFLGVGMIGLGLTLGARARQMAIA